jgi:5-methylcytosine-specific restriction endonuclease McrA
MKIELKEIKIRDLVKGYVDLDEEGVFGYAGQLDIRPPYQRNFIYGDKQREAVIDTVSKGFPLNVMYWAVRSNGGFEVIDGQQRTLSICQYVNGDFSYQKLYFSNLPEDQQERLLDYKLTVYQCTGTDSEKLEWFKTINIAGEKLTDQELRNAVYSGPWVTDAKRYFSRNNCAAQRLASHLLDGKPNRQEYLETVIYWISNDNIEDYMGLHQHSPNADEIWKYFGDVIDWVKTVFTVNRKEMKGIEWGLLFNEHGKRTFNSNAIESEVRKLMEDEDVTNKRGIYEYLLTRKEKHLSIRQFSDAQKREAYEKQSGVCPQCRLSFPIEEMEADHIIPWHQGGKTLPDNCQMLCKSDNRTKGGR